MLAVSVCTSTDHLVNENGGDILTLIMDSGEEEHVITRMDWQRLGELQLKPARVRMRTAAAEDIGATGSIVVRGWCGEHKVEITARVVHRAAKRSRHATDTLCPLPQRGGRDVHHEARGRVPHELVSYTATGGWVGGWVVCVRGGGVGGEGEGRWDRCLLLCWCWLCFGHDIHTCVCPHKEVP